MYSKQEASILRQAFWTAFGKYMQPVPDAEGEKINWVNYRTGVKHIYFRMSADNKQAEISIRLTFAGAAERLTVFEEFECLRLLLHAQLGEEWNWQPDVPDEYGRFISVISKTLEGVNIFRQDDWPALISFFKPRIIALDAFWKLVGDQFLH